MNGGESAGGIGSNVVYLASDDDVIGAVAHSLGGGCDALLIAGGSASGTDTRSDEDGARARLRANRSGFKGRSDEAIDSCPHGQAGAGG